MKDKQIVHNKKKKIIWLLIAILILSSILYLQFYMRRASTPQLFGRAVRLAETQEKVIALTFDVDDIIGLNQGKPDKKRVCTGLVLFIYLRNNGIEDGRRRFNSKTISYA